MTHLHITAWVLALILLISVVILFKAGNDKAAKITQMILQLDYIFILATGIYLFFQVDAGTGYYVKMLFGIVLIAFMDMVLVRTKKNKNTTAYWVLLFIVLIGTIYLGLKLPLGFYIG